MHRLLTLFYICCFSIILWSCENDIKTVTNLIYADTIPLESARDVQVLYSDSAQVQIWLTSPLFNRYDGIEPYLDFPQGLKVIFYDKDQKEKSVLTCLYARVNEKTKVMEARNKVEVVSKQRGQKLNTERLIWDQRKAKIYSDEFVKVTTHDKVLYGQGFESDQSFDNWAIRRPTGSFSIDKDK